MPTKAGCVCVDEFHFRFSIILAKWRERQEQRSRKILTNSAKEFVVTRKWWFISNLFCFNQNHLERLYLVEFCSLGHLLFVTNYKTTSFQGTNSTRCLQKLITHKCCNLPFVSTYALFPKNFTVIKIRNCKVFVILKVCSQPPPDCFWRVSCWPDILFSDPFLVPLLWSCPETLNVLEFVAWKQILFLQPFSQQNTFSILPPVFTALVKSATMLHIGCFNIFKLIIWLCWGKVFMIKSKKILNCILTLCTDCNCVSGCARGSSSDMC